MPDGTQAPTNKIALWEALRPVDKKFTKPITGKGYKGDSPNPTYIIMKLTEQLGPIGQTWGFNVVREEIRQGKPHQVLISARKEFGQPNGDGVAPLLTEERGYQIIREEMHQVEIEFWQITDGERRTFSAFGGTPLLYLAKNGNWIHDEDAAKKSLTDAYTKAASWLGAVADIFLGLYDDKYTSQPHDQDAAKNGSGAASAGSDESSPPESGHDAQRPSQNAGKRQSNEPDW